MRSKSMHKWMTGEMERLSLKFERYKPTGSGYNRIQPILLSRSVTQMLNNPLPVVHQIGSTATHSIHHETSTRPRGVLSRTPSEWEEVYPVVKFSRVNSDELSPTNEVNKKFVFYRNCSTRLT
ncbi:uncharacterized protein LOC119689972 [Teleopsis dalmanni]|uniref:uncharacterized protein LOC119689972 n=1 Tax=Teleopsis dalmanni TaxID=139649 RepID=UPI0018CF2623|nr:uncharacterized protein LOC119689972 [Teleopsis dalmanni]